MVSISRWMPVVLAMVVAMIVLTWQVFVLPIPEGLSGQPRSTPMPEGWTAPVWLIVLFWAGLTATLATAVSALWGVLIYFCVLYVLPVHTPPWIYLLWLQLPSLIAAVTLVAWIVEMRAEPERLNNLRRTLGWLGAGVVVWYCISMLAQQAAGEAWRPPLQFHPLRIFDALVVFLVAATSAVRVRALSAVVTAMSVILIVRFLWVQTSVNTDGDIAALATLTGVVAGGLTLIEHKLPRRLGFALMTGCCALIVWQTHNRAALIAIGAAMLAALICMQRRRFGALVLLLVALAGWQFFSDTNYARRFESAFSSLEAVASNPRVRTWIGGLEMASEYPYTGVGPGNFVYRIGDYKPKYKNHTAHNAFIGAAAETGWFGALLLTAFVFGSLWRALLYATQYRQMTALAVACGIAAYIALTTFLSFTFLAFAYFLMGLTLADESRQTRDKIGSGKHVGIAT